MKKYQQLILVILLVLSFISLLIYRHEYNKLHYVLEVFNFFGTPGMSSHQNVAQNITIEKYIMSEPLPAWQRVSDTLYLYSAYWETQGTKAQVKAPAIGILNENLNFGCYFWYETRSDPVKGQFSFSEILKKNSAYLNKNRGSKTKGFMFYCEVSEKTSIPIGVTFYKTNKDKTSQAFLPIFKVKNDPPVQNSTAICILPNEFSYLRKNNYLEFLSFHRALGIRDYIIYGANFQYSIITSIQKNNSFDINLMVLQWNYPFYEDFGLMTGVAENDCMLRSKGLFENVIVLKWNQFFVPNFHYSAQTVIINMDPEKKATALQLFTSVFCLEYKDDPSSDKSLPLIFTKTKFAILKSDNVVYVYKTNVKGGSIKKVGSDLVRIHWYAKCNGLDLKTQKITDRSILAYQKEVMQSKIMRL